MNEPFDRGEISESSLAATERLRARLMTQGTAPAPRRGGGLAWAVAAALFAFAAGLIANPWFEHAVRGRLPFATAPASDGEGSMNSRTVAALTARLAALEQRAPTAPAVAAERLARSEAQVESATDQIQREATRVDDLTGQVAGLSARLAAQEARDANVIAAAQGAATRAEALLTVLLLRRDVAAGRSLDMLLPTARRVFEPSSGQEMAALSAFSAAPVSRARLAAELGAVDAQAVAIAQPNWWQALTARVAATLSGDAGPGPVMAARAAMARGDVAAAAAALRRSPQLAGSTVVRGWLAAAARLMAAEAALDSLEGVAAQPAVAAAAPGAHAVPARSAS